MEQFQFTRMCDSGVYWVGKIPSHWKMRSVRHAVTIENGSDFKDFAVESGGYPVLGSGGEFARISKFIYDKPSVLLGRKGTIDKPRYIDEPFWTVDTLFYTKIKNDTDPRYFYWFCTTIPFDFFQFGSAIPSMTQGDLYGIRMPTPPLSEQKAIAAYLDRETGRIDALIAEQRNLIGLLVEKRLATISHAVTKGLDGSVPMKESGVEWIGSVPASWNVARLKWSVARAKNGVWGDNPNGGQDDRVCIRVADFDRELLVVKTSRLTIRSVKPSELNGRVLQKGDLLLEKSGGGENQPVGCVVLYQLDGPAVCSNFVAKITLSHGMSPSYWRYLHAAAYAAGITARCINQTSGIQNLDQGRYFDELVCFPDEREQEEIACYLDRELAKIDAMIIEIDACVELLHERRGALISNAVSGRIDVSGCYIKGRS